MAAAVGSRGAIHGINITPLVDIFLVLLILVMISSSLAAPQAIEVKVPRAADAADIAPASSGLVLAPDGSLTLDGHPAGPTEIVERLRARVAADADHGVLISADGQVPYEKVVAAIDLVKHSGARKYALHVRKAA